MQFAHDFSRATSGVNPCCCEIEIHKVKKKVRQTSVKEHRHSGILFPFLRNVNMKAFERRIAVCYSCVNSRRDEYNFRSLPTATKAAGKRYSLSSETHHGRPDGIIGVRGAGSGGREVMSGLPRGVPHFARDCMIVLDRAKNGCVCFHL